MSEPIYRFGDLVQVEGTHIKGVITKITRSNDPEWPHKYKVVSEDGGGLTFDEGSIILLK